MGRDMGKDLGMNMGLDVSESIRRTKQGFEESFQADSFYNQQTRDEEQLNRLLDCLKVENGMKILDLGTGTGYLAFPIAERYPHAEVTGLDIVLQALNRNRQEAERRGRKNLQFISYGGLEFPFAGQSFDWVVSRYALHHFPAINGTFQEISRVLKPGGRLLISDPAPNDCDGDRFVDAYMQMKKDGHIRFYTKNEWIEIGKATGLAYTGGFETKIRFPKKRETAVGFNEIVNRFDGEVIRSYEVEITADEIWITERVNNLLFRKKC